MSDSSDEEDSISKIDFSVISMAIEAGHRMIQEILNCVHYGTPEIRNLMYNECDFIVECRVCRNLFRSIPNFVAHKRIYCTAEFETTQFPSSTQEESVVVVQPTDISSGQTSASVSPAATASSSASVTNSSTARSTPAGSVNHAKSVLSSVFSSSQLSRSKTASQSTESQSQGQRNQVKGQQSRDRGQGYQSQGQQNLNHGQGKQGQGQQNQNQGHRNLSQGQGNKGQGQDERNGDDDSSDGDTSTLKQLLTGKFKGKSSEYNFYSKTAEKMERERRAKETSHVVMTPIPTNRNAAFLTVTKDGTISEAQKAIISSQIINERTNSEKNSSENLTKSMINQNGKSTDTRDKDINTQQNVSVRSSKRKNPDAPKVVNEELANKSSDNTTMLSKQKQMEQKNKKFVQLRPVKSQLGSHQYSELSELGLLGHCDLALSRCLLCSINYSSRKGLLQHMHSIHSGRKILFPCSMCDKKFSYFWGLTRHLQNNHNLTKEKIDKMRDKLKSMAYDTAELEQESTGQKEQLDPKPQVSPGQSSEGSIQGKSCIKHTPNIVQTGFAPRSVVGSDGSELKLHKCDGCKRAFWKKSNYDEHVSQCKWVVPSTLDKPSTNSRSTGSSRSESGRSRSESNRDLFSNRTSELALNRPSTRSKVTETNIDFVTSNVNDTLESIERRGRSRTRSKVNVGGQTKKQDEKSPTEDGKSVEKNTYHDNEVNENDNEDDSKDGSEFSKSSGQKEKSMEQKSPMSSPSKRSESSSPGVSPKQHVVTRHSAKALEKETLYMRTRFFDKRRESQVRPDRSPQSKSGSEANSPTFQKIDGVKSALEFDNVQERKTNKSHDRSETGSTGSGKTTPCMSPSKERHTSPSPSQGSEHGQKYKLDMSSEKVTSRDCCEEDMETNAESGMDDSQEVLIETRRSRSSTRSVQVTRDGVQDKMKASSKRQNSPSDMVSRDSSRESNIDSSSRISTRSASSSRTATVRSGSRESKDTQKSPVRKDTRERESSAESVRSSSRARSRNVSDQDTNRDKSKDKVSARESSKDRISARESSKDRISARESSKDRISARESSKDRISARESSKDRISARESSKDKISSRISTRNRLSDRNDKVESECDSKSEELSKGETESGQKNEDILNCPSIRKSSRTSAGMKSNEKQENRVPESEAVKQNIIDKTNGGDNRCIGNKPVTRDRKTSGGEDGQLSRVSTRGLSKQDTKTGSSCDKQHSSQDKNSSTGLQTSRDETDQSNFSRSLRETRSSLTRSNELDTTAGKEHARGDNLSLATKDGSENQKRSARIREKMSVGKEGESKTVDEVDGESTVRSKRLSATRQKMSDNKGLEDTSEPSEIQVGNMILSSIPPENRTFLGLRVSPHTRGRNALKGSTQFTPRLPKSLKTATSEESTGLQKSFTPRETDESDRSSVSSSDDVNSDFMTSSPEPEVKLVEEIWMEKKPGKPSEEVRSNAYAMMTYKSSSTPSSSKVPSASASGHATRASDRMRASRTQMYVTDPKNIGTSQESVQTRCLDLSRIAYLSDEKEMKCLQCGLGFSCLSNLRRHVVRHLGWRRYKCKLCKFSSYNKSECNTHLIRSHGTKARNCTASTLIIDLNKEASKVRSQKKINTIKSKTTGPSLRSRSQRKAADSESKEIEEGDTKQLKVSQSQGKIRKGDAKSSTSTAVTTRAGDQSNIAIATRTRKSQKLDNIEGDVLDDNDETNDQSDTDATTSLQMKTEELRRTRKRKRSNSLDTNPSKIDKGEVTDTKKSRKRNRSNSLEGNTNEEDVASNQAVSLVVPIKKKYEMKRSTSLDGTCSNPQEDGGETLSDMWDIPSVSDFENSDTEMVCSPPSAKVAPNLETMMAALEEARAFKFVRQRGKGRRSLPLVKKTQRSGSLGSQTEGQVGVSVSATSTLMSEEANPQTKTSERPSGSGGSDKNNELETVLDTAIEEQAKATKELSGGEKISSSDETESVSKETSSSVKHTAMLDTSSIVTETASGLKDDSSDVQETSSVETSTCTKETSSHDEDIAKNKDTSSNHEESSSNDKDLTENKNISSNLEETSSNDKDPSENKENSSNVGETSLDDEDTSDNIDTSSNVKHTTSSSLDIKDESTSVKEISPTVVDSSSTVNKSSSNDENTSSDLPDNSSCDKASPVEYITKVSCTVEIPSCSERDDHSSTGTMLNDMDKGPSTAEDNSVKLSTDNPEVDSQVPVELEKCDVEADDSNGDNSSTKLTVYEEAGAEK